MYAGPTDARPDAIQRIVSGWADAVWDTGIAFGTVGAEVRGERVEITTFRADRYDRESRNPEVAWGTSLTDDLARRDFTVNAMAVSLGPDRTVTDPFGGLGDLLARRLRTRSSDPTSRASRRRANAARATAAASGRSCGRSSCRSAPCPASGSLRTHPT